MMQDPLDVFFDTGRALATVPEDEDQHEPSGDNPAPMRAIEEQAIADDVQLVREKLRMAITGMAEKVPGLLELAMMMQEPEMVDSAAKMVATLSKVSVDLIGIDLRVLQESKKIKDVPPAQPADAANPGTPGTREEREMTTAEVIQLIRRDRQARAAQAPSAETVDVEVKDADPGSATG